MAIKRYTATKDNTITNAYAAALTADSRGTGSNMGMADVVEVFSIYGQASGSATGPSEELTRIIMEFPTSTISTDRTAGTIPASGSVSFYLRLFNAKHVFTLPRRFNLLVQPIGNVYEAASWEEGSGLDMEEYKDKTYDGSGSNWIRRGKVGAWARPGGDFLTASTDISYNVFFPEGYEDLEVDISFLVEDWLQNETGSTGIANYGLGIYLTGSQEAYYSSSTLAHPTGANSDGILNNEFGAQDSYYTKKFFARSSEYVFKRPVLEARWDSRIKDNRGSFYYSSSLATGADNLNTLYLYNYVRGKLTDIPGLKDDAFGADSLQVSVYSGSSVPTGAALLLPVGGGVTTNLDTNITASRVSTGLYTASFAVTGTLTKLFDVWYSGSVQYFTSSLAPKTLAAFNNAPTFQYVSAITNLKAKYTRNETARLRMFIRNKNWSPTVYNVATAQIVNQALLSASYNIYRIIDNLDAIPYGTGSDKQTYMSYDVSGNYFDVDMSLLEAGYSYGISVSYYNNSINDWAEQPETFKFRVD